MRNKRRIFRNVILPVMILIPLIGLMVGCIYIPTWDHTILSGTKKDFRKWSDQHKDAEPPQLAGITRSSIEAMFGKPAFESTNGHCVAYVMGTEHDIAIWPLCFGAGFVHGNVHVLKLVYDNDGRLKHVVPLDGMRPPPTYMFGSDLNKAFGSGNTNYEDPMFGAMQLLRDDSKDCPPDEAINPPTP